MGRRLLGDDRKHQRKCTRQYGRHETEGDVINPRFPCQLHHSTGRNSGAERATAQLLLEERWPFQRGHIAHLSAAGLRGSAAVYVDHKSSGQWDVIKAAICTMFYWLLWADTTKLKKELLHDESQRWLGNRIVFLDVLSWLSQHSSTILRVTSINSPTKLWEVFSARHAIAAAGHWTKMKQLLVRFDGMREKSSCGATATECSCSESSRSCYIQKLSCSQWFTFNQVFSDCLAQLWAIFSSLLNIIYGWFAFFAQSILNPTVTCCWTEPCYKFSTQRHTFDNRLDWRKWRNSAVCRSRWKWPLPRQCSWEFGAGGWSNHCHCNWQRWISKFQKGKAFLLFWSSSVCDLYQKKWSGVRCLKITGE